MGNSGKPFQMNVNLYIRLTCALAHPGCRYDAVWHWAKLEPSTIGEAALQRRLSSHYPVKAFSTYRMLLDPNNVLGNEWLDRVLPIKA